MRFPIIHIGEDSLIVTEIRLKLELAEAMQRGDSGQYQLISAELYALQTMPQDEKEKLLSIKSYGNNL